jgi:hypothetical protein
VTAKTKTLGTVSIKRNVLGGLWDVKGAVGAIAISGDFKGHLTLTDTTGQMTLGKMDVAGWLKDATIESTGPMGMLTVGAANNATVLAGDLTPDVTRHKSIAGFSVKGIKGKEKDIAFINSNVQAWTLDAVVLKAVDGNNAANGHAKFGVKAHYIGSYTRDTIKLAKIGPGTDSEDAVDPDYRLDLSA